MDDAVARLLRKMTKPVLLAVNKVDNAMHEKDAIEFYNPGLENITLLQVFQEAELDLLDALIDHFLLSQNQRKKKLNCLVLLL
jgi:GTP-binding protein